MHVEITSAANFLVQLVRLSIPTSPYNLNENQLALFQGSIAKILRSRYREHWFPEHPNKGSGYRCIRINGKMDPLISQAAAAVGIPTSNLKTLFPFELTLWIDPEEVSYRIGENGSICNLYESERLEKERAFAASDSRMSSFRPSWQNSNGKTDFHAEVKDDTPRQSPELYLDPRQYEQIDPLVDYVGVNC